VLVDDFSSSNRHYSLKEPDILFVEPGPGSGIYYPRARDLARDIGAALRPDVCIRVMVVKTLWALDQSSRGLTEQDETYDSD
jgi:hypothetical protein